MKLLQLLAIGLVLVAPVALGRDSETLKKIVEQQRGIEADIAAGKHDDIEDKYRTEIAGAQKIVFELTAGKRELADLTPVERVKLKNALEDIKSAMAGTFRADEDKDVCWREQILGSKIFRMRCATKEELRIAREGGQGYRERPFTCSGGSCAQFPGPGAGAGQNNNNFPQNQGGRLPNTQNVGMLGN